MPSFTHQVANLLQDGPLVEVRFGIGAVLADILRKQGSAIPEFVAGHALIDTGATRTVVRQDILQQLHLNPVGVTHITTASSQGVRCYEYLARIVFPSNVVIETVVIGAPLRGQPINCLVGRDILSQSVLVYVGYTNTFTLSF
ncbi:hypothetical protein FJZ36_17660 [Candidatus Poribacteria bacterium]|nr:hypothetical protein [Candidatus Poribacteria bacterium]